MILHEPVRGGTPPPWFWALSGIERLQALTQGLLNLPPLWRLQGIRVAHVAPGSGTWTMPASVWAEGSIGVLRISSFIGTILSSVAMTVVAPGQDVEPLTFSTNYFRPARAQAGNLLARARVVNVSRFFVCTEVEVEDPAGRQLARAVGHCVLRQVDPPPPPPPSALRTIDEPVYATPDPHERPIISRLSPAEEWQRHDGLSVVRKYVAGEFVSPLQELYGIRFVEADAGRVVMTLPASEWFCLFSRYVAPGVATTLALEAGAFAGLSLLPRKHSFVGLDGFHRFHRPIQPDGRLLRAEARTVNDRENLWLTNVSVHDTDGTLVSSMVGTGAFIEGADRQLRPEPKAMRILATLLCTDIVDSTGHLERLGDARWRALLNEHRLATRSEIARCEGIEIDNAGDGFLVRFDSPAKAIECARSVRQAAKRLEIEIRAGIHTGECEIQGRSLTGMAVHIAVRVQAAANPGEVLVSRTVRDLAVGSDSRFEDRGERTLKGIPGQWRLYGLAG